MKTEKLVLSFIAILGGLLVAGIVFYIYQTTRTIPSSKIKPIAITIPTPTPKPSIFLSLITPNDESVVNNKTLNISGKTAPDATIVIISKNFEQVVSSAPNGDFSTTLTLGSGSNVIEITAIASNGEQTKITRTVTYSLEEF